MNGESKQTDHFTDTARPRFSGPRYWPTWLGVASLWLGAHMPNGMRLFFGRGLGHMLYWFGGGRRHVADVNLRMCFPKLAAAQRARLLKRTFLSNGIGLLETGTAWFGDIEKLRERVDIEGLEHLQKALEGGKGAILLGAHFTTLDLGGALLSLFADIDVMYRRNKNGLFDRVMKRGRERLYGHAFERKEVRAVLRSLKKNRAVWYAPDQDYGAKHSVFAPFFGIPAATITGTSRFAKMSGAPVIPFSHFRSEDGRRYMLRLHPPLQGFPSGDDVRDATLINSWLEQQISIHPDQYMWLHRRFKTRPEGESRPYHKRIVRKIKPERFEQLCGTPDIKHGVLDRPKVIITSDDQVIKFFFHRKRLSSARIFPPAENFVRNSLLLRERGFLTIRADRVYRCSEHDCDVIIYPLLPGAELRERLEKEPELMQRLPAFMLRMHEAGIMFRAIHLGNILITPENEFALIDIGDLDLRNRPLQVFERARNILHLFNTRDDRDALNAYGLQRFVDEYVKLAGLQGWRERILRDWIRRYFRNA